MCYILGHNSENEGEKMSQVHVDIKQDFNCSVEVLYAIVSEHESLAKIFEPFASFQRLRDGQAGRNDVGSVRKIIVLGVFPFLETYTKAVPNQRLEYVLSGIPPVRQHVSTMTLTPKGQGCELRYTSDMTIIIPLAKWVVQPTLAFVMKTGFKRLAKQFSI